MSEIFDTNLNNAILTSCEKHLNSEAISALIDEQVQKTITEAVDESLRSYSETGEVISKAVKQALAIDGKDFTLPTLSHVVKSIIEKRIESILNDAGRNRLESEIDEIFGTCPAKIKLSELIEKFKEIESDYDSCSCDQSSCTVIVDENDVVGSKYFHIHIDREPDKRIYGCEIQIDVQCTNNEGYDNGELPEGKVFALNFREGKVDKENPHSPFIGPLYSFDRFLFNLYANRSVLVIDEDDVDPYFSHD